MLTLVWTPISFWLFFDETVDDNELVDNLDVPLEFLCFIKSGKIKTF